MASDLEDYADFLFGKGSGYVYTPCKMADGTWMEKFFFWPMERRKCLDYIRTQALVSDVYISPVLHKNQTHKKENLKKSTVVWVEFDGKVELDFKGLPEPNYIVQTSTGDHKHIYWQIDETDPTIVEDINCRITYLLEADGSGWDNTQVLRPPETVNRKPDRNLENVTVIKANPVGKHELSTFDIAPKIERPEIKLEYGSLLELEAVLAKHELPEELVLKVTREIPTVPKMRSTMMMSTAYLLAEAGMTQMEIITCLYEMDHRLKKFVGRADQLDRLAQIAALALLKGTAEKAQGAIYNFMDVMENTDVIEWLIDGFLHKRGIMLLTGPPSVGKTTLIADMIYRMTFEEPIFNKIAVPRIRTLFFSAEMTMPELQIFVKLQGANWTDEQQQMLRDNTMIDFHQDLDEKYIENAIAKCTPEVVIIDSLSEITKDMEEAEAKRIMKFIRKMKEKYNCAFIIIHHNRKANATNKKPVTLNDLYGSFIFGKLSESVLCLWKEDKNDYFELYSMKGRFNNKETMKLDRDESLRYTTRTETEIVIGKNITGPTTSNALLDFK